MVLFKTIPARNIINALMNNYVVVAIVAVAVVVVTPAVDPSLALLSNHSVIIRLKTSFNTSCPTDKLTHPLRVLVRACVCACVCIKHLT